MPRKPRRSFDDILSKLKVLECKQTEMCQLRCFQCRGVSFSRNFLILRQAHQFVHFPRRFTIQFSAAIKVEIAINFLNFFCHKPFKRTRLTKSIISGFVSLTFGCLHQRLKEKLKLTLQQKPFSRAS